MLEVRFRKHGQPEEVRQYPDDRLQEIMDRACKAFGNPELILDGPSTAVESTPISTLIPKPRRKK